MESYIERFKESREKEADIIITVDGPSGSGKGTLAAHIADTLDLKHFSAGDVFRSIADERGTTHVELAEKAGKDVDLEVDRKTLSRGLEESCVIDGRLPCWVLGEYSNLRIFLTADIEERARRIAGREGKDHEQAKEDTEKRDRKNRERYMDYYSIDTDRRDIYDLIVDNTDMSIDEQNELVDKVLKKEFPERYKEQN
jgi:cytidylate kinase, putative